MPRQDRVVCEVVVDPRLAFGVFANAFRFNDTADGRCLLEFLVYSASERQAKVVARVPVRKVFLPVIRDKISGALEADIQAGSVSAAREEGL